MERKMMAELFRTLEILQPMRRTGKACALSHSLPSKGALLVRSAACFPVHIVGEWTHFR